MAKNRKTQKRKRKFSPIKALLIGAIFVVAVALIIEFVDFKAIFSGNNSNNTTDTPAQSAQTTPQNQSANTPEDTPTDQTPSSTPTDQKVPQYEGNDPNSANSITGSISHHSVQGTKLILRIEIDQFLSSGTCQLVMTHQNGSTYQATANIAEPITTSTCEGFDVPTSSLSSGKWTIVVTIKSGDKSGKITGEVSL